MIVLDNSLYSVPRRLSRNDMARVYSFDHHGVPLDTLQQQEAYRAWVASDAWYLEVEDAKEKRALSFTNPTLDALEQSVFDTMQVKYRAKHRKQRNKGQAIAC
jgi:hypothetical protein